MKKHVEVFDYCGHICKALSTGVLLTSATAGKVNTMTIGWGHLGIEWNTPIFVAYVRRSRFTSELIDQTNEFSINIPMNGKQSDILRYCGTKSGRNTDKIRDMGLTLEDGETITVPGIKEFPLTLECKVLYKQTQDSELLPQSLKKRFYRMDEELAMRDNHIAYYAQITSAYLIENEP